MAIFKTSFHVARNIPCVADVALTGGQVVKVTTGGQKPGVTPTAAKGESAIGVVDVDADVGEEVSVTTEFHGRLTATGAVAAGDKLTSDAGGTVSVVSAGEEVFADALSAAADGESVHALRK